MKRTPLKTVENKIIEFIPDRYKDFDKASEDIMERPLVFCGKRMTREQKYEFQDIIKITYPKGVDISKLNNEELGKIAKTKGSGDAYKYIWQNCISYIKNVIIEVNDEVKTFDKVEDEETKNLLWGSAQDFDTDLIQAISFFVSDSSFTEEESKN